MAPPTTRRERYLALHPSIETLLTAAVDHCASIQPDESPILYISRWLAEHAHEVASGDAEAAPACEVSLEEDAATPSSPAVDETTWNVPSWLRSLDLHTRVAEALAFPAGADAFAFTSQIQRSVLSERLRAAHLGGLIEPVWRGVEVLRSQGARTGAELSAKFAADDRTFSMSFGGLEMFFGGLESLVGPPRVAGGSIMRAMEMEHTNEADSHLPFDTSNGMSGVTSAEEWEFVSGPHMEDRSYKERALIALEHPDWRRAQLPPDELHERMMECNGRLASRGQSSLIIEEVVGARLCARARPPPPSETRRLHSSPSGPHTLCLSPPGAPPQTRGPSTKSIMRCSDSSRVLRATLRKRLPLPLPRASSAHHSYNARLRLLVWVCGGVQRTRPPTAAVPSERPSCRSCLSGSIGMRRPSTRSTLPFSSSRS
jgi:hypothetical protein